MLQNNLLKKTVSNSDVGYWEITKNILTWSPAFTTNLGYDSNSIVCSPEFFINQMLHKDFRASFTDNYYGFTDKGINFQQLVQIRTNAGEHKEYMCKTNDRLPINIHKNSKVLFFIERNHKTADEFIQDNYFYYRESAQMTSTGSWCIDFVKQKSFWDFETRRILEYPEDYVPSLKRSQNYYALESQELAANLFFKCAMTGEPFDSEIKMKTKNNREFWARAMGKPIYNDNGDIVGLRGVFQNIDKIKERELKLKKSYDIITSQNTRLVNFAGIVSHNLKSHSGNLSLLVEMIEETNDVKEKLELLSNIKSVSNSLNLTVTHLKEVASIQTNKKLEKTTISFNETLNNVKESIGHIIAIENATICTDIKIDTIEYVPAYLDSILLNLLTNAIKYRQKDKAPIIKIRTFLKNKRIILEVEDNGLGIDMKKHGDKLFEMYKTFHLNKDAVGIGLFLTKNQIESLEGTINAESEIGVGTTFRVCF